MDLNAQQTSRANLTSKKDHLPRPSASKWLEDRASQEQAAGIGIVVHLLYVLLQHLMGLRQVSKFASASRPLVH